MDTLRSPDVELSDAELVRRCIERDAAAVRELTRRYNQRLYRIARSILGDAADAEDAVQDVYLKAFGSLEHFRGEAAVGTWLTRIAINEALGRARRRRPTIAWEPSSEATLHPHMLYHSPSASPDPEMSMAHQEMQSLLERSIDALPEPLRLVFVARFVEGLSVEETADLLAIRPETVKTRAHRARRRLKRDLERRLGATVPEAFRFDGPRCTRLTELVIQRLAEGKGSSAGSGNLPGLSASNPS
jgi:RNA polymerase sigma-70 factor, ECF subfamily